MTIRLHRDAGKMRRAEITSSRPLGLAGLFRGKSPRQVLETMPLLFSICAKAQCCAAVEALEQAGAIDVPDNASHARRMIVLAETAREHVLRIALDWPGFLRGPAQQLDARQMMRLPDHLMKALFEDGAAFLPGARPQIDTEQAQGLIDGFEGFLQTEIFGEAVDAWRVRTDVGSVNMWAGAQQTLAARLVKTVVDHGWGDAGNVVADFLPAVSDQAFLAGFNQKDNGETAQAPLWEAAPLETSCLSRQYDQPVIRDLTDRYGTGLLTRLAARLVELARIPQQMQDLLTRSAASDGDVQPSQRAGAFAGCGAAQVEAARGRLVHLVALDQGQVSDYRILAPTEWNFHTQGPAAKALAQLPGDDAAELNMLAGLLITAIDPCVGYEVRVD